MLLLSGISGKPALSRSVGHYCRDIGKLMRPLFSSIAASQRVMSVTVTSNSERTETATFSAGVFVDASYEGDLMAKAGVSYVVGRESVDKYNESLAGCVALERVSVVGETPPARCGFSCEFLCRVSVDERRIAFAPIDEQP